MTTFTCDYATDGHALPHFWEHCVGSGHATLALRADWRAQLAQCHDDLGFRHVRFHGVLDDDMGTLVDETDELLYSFHNADQIYDFVRSLGMRPIVELSFMPRALSSGDTTVFHYNANVTPPADYTQWASFISKLASHWIERYGAAEVSRWPIEVWNEPNMDSFWTGSQADYFRLFEMTHKALKHVHGGLQVGGPVTAQNAWIDDFLEFCAKNGVPPDFISTHTYPTDAFGSPDDDTQQALSKSHLGILRERAEKVRKQAGKLPLYYTEWCTSSNPRDELHDDPYAAAYVMHAMLNMGTLVDAYSYWTFSDIFEENYFPSKPFQGGFGLMNIHGIPKPVYRAYEILHRLGDQRLVVKGNHDTVGVWVVRDSDARGVTVVIVNLALPLHPIEAETVTVEFVGLPAVDDAHARRIDADHANAKATWKMQGEPRYPSASEVTAMIDASQLQTEPVALHTQGGKVSFEIDVQPQSVTAIDVRFAALNETGAERTQAKAVPALDASDDALLDSVQSAAFRYFTEAVNPANGLIADSSAKGSAASSAAVGFALSCYPVAVERGWFRRDDAVTITRNTLKFFADSRQDSDPKATGYKGFYYHFLDMQTGERANNCELSTIDTALLLAGAAVAAQYFDRDDNAESEIRALGETLLNRVDWHWTLDDDNEVMQAWTPENGFSKSEWEGYTEALIMWVMGAASPSHPFPREAYESDINDYHWSRNSDLEWIQASPLFIHLFPQAWLDLRDLDDGVVGQRDAGQHRLDYFENTRRAITVQRDYAKLNPHSFVGYGENIWGLSACNGPHGERRMRDGRKLACLGYAARGVPRGPDDGTLVPWAAATCMAHAPNQALAGLNALLETYPHARREGQFVGAINPSLPGEGTDGIWAAPNTFGLDQGLVVMMIENARSGLIWELTRKAPTFRRGLKHLNFSGGWLS